jgi:hypothetical protein
MLRRPTARSNTEIGWKDFRIARKAEMCRYEKHSPGTIHE